VNIDALGEANSSDSEPEDFCICGDESNTSIVQHDPTLLLGHQASILLCTVQV